MPPADPARKSGHTCVRKFLVAEGDGGADSGRIFAFTVAEAGADRKIGAVRQSNQQRAHPARVTAGTGLVADDNRFSVVKRCEKRGTQESKETLVPGARRDRLPGGCARLPLIDAQAKFFHRIGVRKHAVPGCGPGIEVIGQKQISVQLEISPDCLCGPAASICWLDFQMNTGEFEPAHEGLCHCNPNP